MGKGSLMKTQFTRQELELIYLAVAFTSNNRKKAEDELDQEIDFKALIKLEDSLSDFAPEDTERVGAPDTWEDVT